MTTGFQCGDAEEGRLQKNEFVILINPGFFLGGGRVEND